VLGQNAHGKGGAVCIPVFAVRRRRTTKSAIPVVIHAKREKSYYDSLCYNAFKVPSCVLGGTLCFNL
jgi:hypothetical protein